jgi:hypothetical protein
MMDRLSESEIDKLAKLDRDATPGPWRESMSGYSIKSNDADCPIVAAVHGVARATQKQVRLFLDNAALIAAARNALPALLTELRALRKVEADAREILVGIDNGCADADDLLRFVERIANDGRALTPDDDRQKVKP